MSQSSVDALSELSFPFIAAIASDLFPKKSNIGHSNNYGPNGPNRKRMGCNY